MLYGLLVTFFVILSLFLGLLILVQKGKGGLGLGYFGGSSQLIFGGSGGQDILQKMTWICGSLFMLLVLLLAILKVSTMQRSSFLPTTKAVQTQQEAPQAPAQEPATQEAPASQE